MGQWLKAHTVFFARAFEPLRVSLFCDPATCFQNKGTIFVGSSACVAAAAFFSQLSLTLLENSVARTN